MSAHYLALRGGAPQRQRGAPRAGMHPARRGWTRRRLQCRTL